MLKTVEPNVLEPLLAEAERLWFWDGLRECQRTLIPYLYRLEEKMLSETRADTPGWVNQDSFHSELLHPEPPMVYLLMSFKYQFYIDTLHIWDEFYWENSKFWQHPWFYEKTFNSFIKEGVAQPPKNPKHVFPELPSIKPAKTVPYNNSCKY